MIAPCSVGSPPGECDFGTVAVIGSFDASSVQWIGALRWRLLRDLRGPTQPINGPVWPLQLIVARTRISSSRSSSHRPGIVCP